MTDRGRRKLTDEQVAAIRAQYEYGRRPKLIAKEFSITVYHVWKIAAGWRRKK